MSERGDDSSKTVAHEIRYRHSSGTRCATAKESQKLSKKVTLFGCEMPLLLGAIKSGEKGVADASLCINSSVEAGAYHALMDSIALSGFAEGVGERYAYTQPISFLAEVAGITGGEYSPLYLQTANVPCTGTACCPNETIGTMQTSERGGRSVAQQTQDFFRRVVQDNQPFSIGIAK